jgi:hypothetical protein
VTHTFGFTTPEEFEAKAREAALAFIPQLRGKTFHIRFYRRGTRRSSRRPPKSGFSTRRCWTPPGDRRAGSDDV